jgi:hypothetical protein
MDRESPRPATDETTDDTAPPMSGIEHRAQDRVVEQAEIVTFVEEERSLPVGETRDRAQLRKCYRNGKGRR